MNNYLVLFYLFKLKVVTIFKMIFLKKFNLKLIFKFKISFKLNLL
jgi:hypothetical protein